MKAIDTHLHLDDRHDESALQATRRLLQGMQAGGVERGVVLHLEAQPWSLEEVAAAVVPNPELLLFANVHPFASDASERLRYAVKELGCRGLKLHPRLQNYPVDHPSTHSIVQLAGELGVPALIDAFPDGDWLMQGHTLLDYAALAKAAQNTNLIVAHMAGHLVLDAMMIAKRLPNMYFDTSFSLLYYRKSSVPADLCYAMRSMRFKKVFYGSDYPDRGVAESLSQSVEVMKAHGMAESELSAILYQNALEFMPWQTR